MVTNYAKRRVKLRIESAKFQVVLIVFCNRAVLLFNFLIKKTMDSDESYHSESEFYYPNEEDKENNAVRLYWENCALCLEYSFSQYGPTKAGE